MVAVNVKFEQYDVLIDRKSRWGNKYIMGRDGDRDNVCDLHRAWLWREIKAGRITLEDLAALRGKRLGCHCAPLRCHGDTLSAAAEWAYWQLNAARKAG